MKRLLFLIVFTITSSHAQEISKNTIGTRFLSSTGIRDTFSYSFFSYNVTYQRKLKDNTRIEINTTFSNRFNHFFVNGLYEWVWVLKNNFNWYTGAGVTILPTNEFHTAASGIVGIEYDFKAPLLISLEYRPGFYITNNSGFIDGFGLTLRYQF